MQKLIFFVCIISGLLSCKSKTQMMEKELALFIEDHEKKVIPLNIELGKLWYDAAVTGKDSFYRKASDVKIQVTNIYTNKSDFAQLKKYKESGLIKDTLLARQLDILYLLYLGNQTDTLKLAELIRGQNDIEQTFAACRAEAGNKKLSDNQVDSILRYSTDSKELETVWSASKKVGSKVAADLIALVKKRNAVAKDLGFSNFQEMNLKLTEQDPDEIEDLFDELDVLTREGYERVKNEIDVYLSKRFALPADKLMPWHFQNRFFQEAPAIYSVNLDKYYEKADILKISEEFYEGIGLQVKDIIDRSDLYEKPGKNQHAFCTDIDRSGDVRILLNLRNDSYWMNTALHELGHGVYSKYNDPSLPYFLRDAAHILTTEGIALMFGRFYSNPYWMKDNIGINDEEVNKIKNDCKNTLRLEQLIFSRWSQVMFRFEKAMYENPDQNLNELWWDLVEKYQLLKRPVNRDEPDWASKIHIATVPCYYHNYLLGDLFASQLYYYICESLLQTEPGKESLSGKTSAGLFLKEKIFRPGMRYPWNDMVEKATGEKLTAKYYAKQFVN